eukprot:SAG11_NODE_1550_length_4699_cov_6.841522_3_plen_115_part_00
MPRRERGEMQKINMDQTEKQQTQGVRGRVGGSQTIKLCRRGRSKVLHSDRNALRWTREQNKDRRRRLVLESVLNFVPRVLNLVRDQIQIELDKILRTGTKFSTHLQLSELPKIT